MNAVDAIVPYKLPALPVVKDLLSMLFDGLSVKAGAKLNVAPKAVGYAAVYVTDDGTPTALCGCDMAFAANSGAALSMLPPGVAKEAARDKELTPVMLANLHEVMNICTRLLISEGSPHVTLREMCLLSALPAPAAAILTAAKTRMDYEVSIGKYGPGILTVMSL